MRAIEVYGGALASARSRRPGQRTAARPRAMAASSMGKPRSASRRAAAIAVSALRTWKRPASGRRDFDFAACAARPAPRGATTNR